MDERGGRMLAYIFMGLFVGINIYLLWFPNIIQDISEGFSSCERPVRILFGGKNATELPLPADVALLKWSKFPLSQPKLIANQRPNKGFVSIIVPVFELNDTEDVAKINTTLRSLIRHSWNKDQLEMTVVVVLHSPNTTDKLPFREGAVAALITEYIYFINVGFVTFIQLPVDHKIYDRRKKMESTNETKLEFHDERDVFLIHYQQLSPYLESWNSHVMLLCPGYVAEERVISSMKHHMRDVMTSGKGPYDGYDKWVVLDYSREDAACPGAGRLMRTSHYRGLHEFMTMFDRIQSASESLEMYLQVKSQRSVYLMKPVLFRNPSNTEDSISWW